jgi:hypothetical protein
VTGHGGERISQYGASLLREDLLRGDGAMFEVGKSYTIRMWEEGEEGTGLADYDNCEVVEVSLPLIKFRQATNEDVIVNTASMAFVQATLETEEELEEEAAE